MIAGNFENKYESRNPIAKRLMGNFIKRFDYLLKEAMGDGASSLNEIGCGEGYLTRHIRKIFRGRVAGCDVSERIVKKAMEYSEGQDIHFYKKSIYELDKDDSADIIVCCEVLEHLSDPALGLERLASAGKYIILSVPREPVWRILNMSRLKYIRNFGNTPGHLQHWSRGEFLRFAGRRLDIVVENSPFPWTMLLGRKKQNGQDEGLLNRQIMQKNNGIHG